MLSLAKRVPIRLLSILLLTALGLPTSVVGSQTPVPTTARYQTLVTGRNTVTNALSEPPTCNTVVSSTNGAPLASSALCTVGQAQVDVGARVSPSTVFDPANPNAYSVAELGVFNSVTPLLAPSFDRSGADIPLQLNSQVVASFRDYLQLSAAAPINSLALTFALTGTGVALPQQNVLESTFGSGRVTYGFIVGATSGYTVADVDASGNPVVTGFLSAGQFGQGSITVSRTATDLAPAPVQTVSSTSITNSPLTLVATPASTGCVGDCFTVELGSRFFDNAFLSGFANNDKVQLDFTLFAYVDAADQAYYRGTSPPATTSFTADFMSTFRMVGLNAFDALGNDITATAGLQFVGAPFATLPEEGDGGAGEDDGDGDGDGSDDGGAGTPPTDPQPPTSTVPEPASATLVALGLGGLVVASRRRAPRG